jgi:glycerol-3-phosphate cytidylyltransferase
MIGFLAGSFDVIHPGYIHMFDVSKKHCDYLVVALHDNPTTERTDKLTPILNVEERKLILQSIKYIDSIITYNTEEDLLKILIDTKPDIRFLGDDYIGKEITGGELNIPIHYIGRSHGWSTTKFKNKIYTQIKIHNEINTNFSFL